MQKRLSTFSKIVPIIVGMLLSGCGPAAVPIAAGLITGAAGAGSKILAERRARDARDEQERPYRNFKKNYENAADDALECMNDAQSLYLEYDESRWFGDVFYTDGTSISVSQMIDKTKLQSRLETKLLVNWSDEIDRCWQPFFLLLDSYELPKLKEKVNAARSNVKKTLFNKNETVVGYIKGEYTRGDVASKISSFRQEIE